MLTLACFDPETNELLAYNLTNELAEIYRQEGLLIKLIPEPHIVLTDGVEEKNG
jgi:hypothetical protein